MKKITFLISFMICLQTSVFSQYSWSNVGLGTNLSVQALAADTNNQVLYVGGLFSLAGGSPSLNIAKWDGANYSPIGSGIISGQGVYALLVMPVSGDLIAGGTFTNIGGTSTKNIARWNGSAWLPLGLGLDSASSSVVVRALAIYNNELYAGGIFSNSGGTPTNFIAKWDGANWLPLGTGTNGIVRSLAVYNNELYVGGTFTNAGGVSVNNIAKWDGSNWSDVGGGCSYTGAISVSALQVYGGSLFAGGTFTTAGTTPVNHIAKWNGTGWTDVGGGASNYTGAISVSAFQLYGNGIVAGGTFDSLGTNAASNIGIWNGAAWSGLGSGMNNSVYALAAMKDTLYAGGLFTMADVSNTPFIAQWKPNISSMILFQNVRDEINTFSLFPNPAMDAIRIRNKNVATQNLTFNFILTDALGREISKATNIREEMNFERKDISSGLYFYKITGRDNKLLQEGKILFVD